MGISTTQPGTTEVVLDVRDDELWSDIYPPLLAFVTHQVYKAHLPGWIGQEYDIAYDIALSAIRKTIEYVQHLQQDGIVVISLQALVIVIARNHFQDTRRKDARLIHGDTATRFLEEIPGELVGDVADEVVEHLYDVSLFQQAAELIADFPPKERQAILADLATRVHKQGDFDGQPTPLRQAFIDVGIFLEDYLPPVAETSVMRSRRASLASLGYKHIAQAIRR